MPIKWALCGRELTNITNHKVRFSQSLEPPNNRKKGQNNENILSTNMINNKHKWWSIRQTIIASEWDKQAHVQIHTDSCFGEQSDHTSAFFSDFELGHFIL